LRHFEGSLCKPNIKYSTIYRMEKILDVRITHNTDKALNEILEIIESQEYKRLRCPRCEKVRDIVGEL